MASFKPAYLIHGDDHGRLAERRARLRVLAEAESGPGGVEVLEGDACTPDAVAVALSTLTFATGRRFVIADGVERWKDADVEVLERLLADPPPDTTVAFFAREEGRLKAPERLHAAVTSAGGAVDAERAVKPWDLPKWAVEEARRLGLDLPLPAARALVHRVGERQQRLLRELERLALELGPGGRVDPDEVEELTASSAERKAWTLADALVARDGRSALGSYLELRGQGERLPSLLYWMTQRVRLALEAATRLEAGDSPADVKRTLRMPPRAANAFLEDVRRSDPESLRAAVERLADLELQSRGGELLAEDTAALRALTALAGSRS